MRAPGRVTRIEGTTVDVLTDGMIVTVPDCPFPNIKTGDDVIVDWYAQGARTIILRHWNGKRPVENVIERG